MPIQYKKAGTYAPIAGIQYKKDGVYSAVVGAFVKNLGAYQNVLSLLLDTFPVTAVLAHSMRKLRTAYTGPCIRVRRASDNVEIDINFASSGWLDEAALLSFTGPTGGAFMTTWYDQSGNGNNYIQPTAGAQPQIVTAGIVVRLPGLSRTGVATNGANQTMYIPTTFNLTMPLSRASIIAFYQLGTESNPFDGFGTSNRATLQTSSGSALQMGSNPNFNIGFPAVNDLLNIIELQNGASSVGFYNGTKTSGQVPAATLSGSRLGSYNGSGGFFNGAFGESIVFGSMLSDADATTMRSNQKLAWGTL